ncbi:unnamed protein product [Ostreobium quekettii]|uniref:Uncharacterized protein n=1 Tax=Ostreobium quekettii TaxID=121088 RepID=A0A8S1INV7_9CHLO|nr:unnamed protein product [Ostreobium quekettii]
MSLIGDGDASENWQQQVEEISALSAIYGEDFRLVGIKGIPESMQQRDLDIGSLADIQLSSYDVTLEGEVHISAILPNGEVELQVGGDSGNSSSATENRYPAGKVWFTVHEATHSDCLLCCLKWMVDHHALNMRNVLFILWIMSSISKTVPILNRLSTFLPCPCVYISIQGTLPCNLQASF